MTKGFKLSDRETMPKFLTDNGYSNELYEKWIKATPGVHARIRKSLSDILVKGPGLINVRATDDVAALELPGPHDTALRRNGIFLVGDVVLFTQEQLAKKERIGKKAFSSIISAINQTNLSFGTSILETDAERLARVYGSVNEAPAISLVPLANLPSVVVSKEGSQISSSRYRAFVEASLAMTIGEITLMTINELADRAAKTGFHQISTAINVFELQTRHLY